MSANVLLILLKELRKGDEIRGLPSFHKEFDKFNNTKAQMLESIYHVTIRLF